MKPTKWETQLRQIIPDYSQRQEVIKFIKEFKKEWSVSVKKKSKQKSLFKDKS